METKTEQEAKIDTARLGNGNTEQDKRFIVNQNRIKEIERIRKVEQAESENIETGEQGVLREDNEDNREPLSLDIEIVKKILLSYGGGSDGFKLYFNSDKELLRGVYFMSDWSEYQESELTDEEAEEVFNFYLYGHYE